MKISEYAKEYTSGKPVTFGDVVSEINELLVEIFKLNKSGIAEEFEDVFHFIQLWLYCRFNFDGEIWGITRNSVKKFMDRKLVWNKIYVLVGLAENISGYAGNYKKVEKVVNHLQQFGISQEKAKEAHEQVALEIK